jgi:hypothetical protein
MIYKLYLSYVYRGTLISPNEYNKLITLLCTYYIVRDVPTIGISMLLHLGGPYPSNVQYYVQAHLRKVLFLLCVRTTCLYGFSAVT